MVYWPNFIVFRKIISKWFFFILWYWVIKPKNKDDGQNLYTKFGFYGEDFAQDAHSLEGIWKSTRVRRRARGPKRRPNAAAEARGPGFVPEGIFKSTMGEGIWGKIHETKCEFYTYFFKSYKLSTSTNDQNLKTLWKNWDKNPSIKKWLLKSSVIIKTSYIPWGDFKIPNIGDFRGVHKKWEFEMSFFFFWQEGSLSQNKKRMQKTRPLRF